MVISDEMQRQAAQAYADQQASYMSHHVAAMEAESRVSIRERNGISNLLFNYLVI